MVQMKVIEMCRDGEGTFNFISHMVQMKEAITEQFAGISITLYPTWFR